MRFSGKPIAMLASIVVAAAAPAWATSLGLDPVSYKLTDESLFEAGCFGPCACPVLVRQPVGGTFTLVSTGFDGLYENFDVRNVAWVVPDGGPGVRVTGSGTYRFGGEVASQQQLQLDLVVDGGPTQHYDSGLVGITRDFPAIDVSVALHGFFCHDTAFRVAAGPSVAAVSLGDPAHPGLHLTPNPFRVHADIGFALPGPGPIDASIYDVTGREVRALGKGRWFDAGRHVLAWDGRGNDGARLPPGVYLVEIRALGRNQRGTLIKY